MENYAALEVTNAKPIVLQNGYNIIGGIGNANDEVNNVILDCSSVDIKHAVILYHAKDSTAKVMDLFSDEKTFVNDDAIVPFQWIDIADKAKLKFGHVSCEIVMTKVNSQIIDLDDEDTSDGFMIPATPPPNTSKGSILSRLIKRSSSCEESKDNDMSKSVDEGKHKRVKEDSDDDLFLGNDAENETMVLPKKHGTGDDFFFIPATQQDETTDNTTAMNSDDDNSFFFIETQSVFQENNKVEESENVFGFFDQLSQRHETASPQAPSVGSIQKITIIEENNKIMPKKEAAMNEPYFDDTDSTDCDENMMLEHYSLTDLKNSSKESKNEKSRDRFTAADDSDKTTSFNGVPVIPVEVFPYELEMKRFEKRNEKNGGKTEPLDQLDPSDVATQVYPTTSISFQKNNNQSNELATQVYPTKVTSLNRCGNKQVDPSELETQVHPGIDKFFLANQDEIETQVYSVENGEKEEDPWNAATQIWPKPPESSLQFKQKRSLFKEEEDIMIFTPPVLSTCLPTAEECKAIEKEQQFVFAKKQKMLFGDSSDEDDPPKKDNDVTKATFNKQTLNKDIMLLKLEKEKDQKLLAIEAKQELKFVAENKVKQAQASKTVALILNKQTSPKILDDSKEVAVILNEDRPSRLKLNAMKKTTPKVDVKINPEKVSRRIANRKLALLDSKDAIKAKEQEKAKKLAEKQKKEEQRIRDKEEKEIQIAKQQNESKEKTVAKRSSRVAQKSAILIDAHVMVPIKRKYGQSSRANTPESSRAKTPDGSTSNAKKAKIDLESTLLTDTSGPSNARSRRAKSTARSSAEPAKRVTRAKSVALEKNKTENVPGPHKKTLKLIRTPKKKICFTLIDRRIYTSAIKKLGGELVENFEDCNVLCTNKVVRSVKFMSAIARGIPIVSPNWITESEKQNRFENPVDYLLKDEEGEKRFDFVLEQSLEQALRKRLFENHTFIVMPDVVNPPPEDLIDIIKSASGRVLQKVPAKMRTVEHVFVVIQSKNARYKQFKLDHPQCKTTFAEYIMRAVLSQNLNLLCAI